MRVDLGKVRSGDKVILRDGSKIVVDDRGGKMRPMVMTHYLTVWSNDGQWSESYPDCPFDIVGIIHGVGKSTRSKGPAA